LVEYVVDEASGATVIVEVDETESEAGEERAARPGEIERADRSFQDALERVKPAASALAEKIRSLADPPDETTMEFGIKLTGKAGAVIASAGIEANYKITLTWNRK
jgi:hypothetical protein